MRHSLASPVDLGGHHIAGPPGGDERESELEQQRSSSNIPAGRRGELSRARLVQAQHIVYIIITGRRLWSFTSSLSSSGCFPECSLPWRQQDTQQFRPHSDLTGATHEYRPRPPAHDTPLYQTTPPTGEKDFSLYLPEA